MICKIQFEFETPQWFLKELKNSEGKKPKICDDWRSSYKMICVCESGSMQFWIEKNNCRICPFLFALRWAQKNSNWTFLHFCILLLFCFVLFYIATCNEFEWIQVKWRLCSYKYLCRPFVDSTGIVNHGIELISNQRFASRSTDAINRDESDLCLFLSFVTYIWITKLEMNFCMKEDVNYEPTAYWKLNV